MSFTIESARLIFPNTKVANAVPATVESFNQLSAEDQLALLWFAYTEMGVTITPAAMQVVNIVFAEKTLTQIKQMSAHEQTQVMCDLVNHTDTEICRTYSSFGTNVKLGFWYQLGEWMKQGIVAPIPEGYKLSTQASDVLEAIRLIEGGQQLSILQDIVVNMGYAYAPTVGTQKVKKPVVPPKDPAPRAKVSIEGIDNFTVLSYMENMNAFDFKATVALFTEDGALQPPFQEPIVGHESILAYMREECYGLKLIPERGVSEPAQGEFTQIKVTGKVQTPWFADSVSINLAWRFLLNPQGKIFFVAIDMLASPQELLKLGVVS
ncbi:orange carotenoid-binding protein [Aetokthonos hydrillicola Thurmond2011]|uniref:Orange carotenoid-binding protein n=1 Tax=Aetokthonos hydrillicola Thurmond2011 TaxID=2712845 RepID=A0AAP5MDK2_9CYAN|nr:orange carotenoid-binding protein [Aetokthonos hydrillicola]MBO3463616.1 Red carotenoid-binding protein [Aetokthonos hydrillicola CCALA 1050]MBW4591187.1 orange carotenoid-binding protein [Aetokthonos hydrillicola CCALA 1050]MDR9899718.1 orange carotenoid-binding protein [Aetokthonos hydrillicola Thurmond2011]